MGIEMPVKEKRDDKLKGKSKVTPFIMAEDIRWSPGDGSLIYGHIMVRSKLRLLSAIQLDASK